MVQHMSCIAGTSYRSFYKNVKACIDDDGLVLVLVIVSVFRNKD